MANNVYTAGLNNVGSYQVSGIPYITGSTSLAPGHEDTITFPYVARSVTVINHTSDLIRVHFNSTSSAGRVVAGLHFVELDSDEDSYTFNVKAKEIYISAPSSNGGNASFTIVAELTQIPVARMYALTGSGLTTINGD